MRMKKQYKVPATKVHKIRGCVVMLNNNSIQSGTKQFSITNSYDSNYNPNSRRSDWDDWDK